MFALAVLLAAQSAPAPAALVSVAEARMMCAGESQEAAAFRTGAAYALLAQYERAKCHMYLLGIAQGLETAAAERGERRCLPVAMDREALAEHLAAAVAARAAEPAADIADIVRDAVRAHYGCRS